MVLINARFLDDQPVSDVSQSCFAVHEKIADCIVDDIVKGDSSANKRIALVGEWGSGKSTVLAFVEQGLVERQQVQEDASDRRNVFLTFDLWSHSGEALQRCFLQSLYAKLDGIVRAHEGDTCSELESYCEATGTTRKAYRACLDRWRGIGEKVASEYRVEHTSSAGFVPLVSLVAAVAGGALAAGRALTGALAATADGEAASVYSSIDVLLAVATVALVAGIASLVFRCRRINQAGFAHPVHEVFREVVAPLVGMSVERSEVSTAIEVPGSIAFRGYLRDMLACAAAAAGPMRIVVALDNLDRLPGRRAQEAWSAVQSFADALSEGSGAASGTSGDDGDDARDAVTWLLLPIAMDTAASLAGDEGTLDALEASGALSKLFVKRYDIPQPVSLEWNGFVLSCLRQAFPGLERDADAEQFACSVIESVPEIRRFRASREVVKLVNDMVALYRVYGGIAYQTGNGETAHIGVEAVTVFAVIKHLHAPRETVDTPLEREAMAVLVSGVTPTAGGFSLPNHILARKDLATPLAMMSYGVLDSQVAAACFLTDSLETVEGIRELDLQRRIADMPGVWDALFRYVRDGRLVSAVVGDGERYMTLLEELVYAMPLPDEAFPLLREMAVLVEYSQWPAYLGGGRLVVSLISAAGPNSGCAEHAFKALRNGPMMLIPGAEYDRWHDNAFTLLHRIDWEHEGVALGRISVELGKMTYDFIRDLFGMPWGASALDVIDFVGQSGCSSVEEGLAKSLSNPKATEAEDAETFLRFVARSSIYARDSARTGQPVELRQSEEFRCFFALWFIYRISRSNVAWTYCEQFKGFEAMFEYAKAPYELAACLAVMLDKRLKLQDGHQLQPKFSSQPDASSLVTPDVIRCFAFEGNYTMMRDTFDMVFGNLENSWFRDYRLAAARAILEQGRGIIPERDYAEYQRLLGEAGSSKSPAAAVSKA